VFASTRPDIVSISIDTITQPLPRLCVCSTCQALFARPEHLRRHVHTVHEKKERLPCKVASCAKPFPRADNLRAHYWTHVKGHGRRGRNECERSVGTVFQLPDPDAIYSRDKEKERKVGRHLMFVFAHGPRAAEAR
jgi:hypothetical protein